MERARMMLDVEYSKEIERARRDLRALISNEQCAPIMLRLAWHDAGTYDAKKTISGGPNGLIRNQKELSHKANKGLERAVYLCETVKEKYKKITYADLYQLAGVVAVEVTGGPTIDFVPGRKDSEYSPEEGRLPDAEKGAGHLRETFNRMWLYDKDIVALLGGLTLGKGHMDKSCSDAGKKVPLKFDNSYFIELRNKAEKKDKSDEVLVNDQAFRHYVDLYAKDQEVFFRDYAQSHKKFSELGFGLKFVTKTMIGVAVTTTIVILSYLYRVRRQHGKKWKST